MFSDNSEIRNIGFILGLLLQFVVDFEETCETDEDGWRFSVVKKVDKYGVTIHGLYSATMALLVDSMRSHMDDDKAEEEAGDSEDRNIEKVNERPNFIRAYDPAPYNSAPTNEVPELGLSRSWDASDWK